MVGILPIILPEYDVLKKLRLDGLSNSEIARQYDVTANSVRRALVRGAKRSKDPTPISTGREKSDLVNKRLIVGELEDFMRGYGVNESQMCVSLGVSPRTVNTILHKSTPTMHRVTAHRIVNAIMEYERLYGEPVDFMQSLGSAV